MRVARFSVDGGVPRYGIVDVDDDGVDEIVVLAGDPIAASIDGGGFDTTGERVPLADLHRATEAVALALKDLLSA